MNRVAILTPLVVGVAALFTFKRRWIENFAMSHLKKHVFVPFHVAIISAIIVSSNALPSMVLMLFAVLVDKVRIFIL
jgi:ABC-type molybdate transport system permease subunit